MNLKTGENMTLPRSSLAGRCQTKLVKCIQHSDLDNIVGFLKSAQSISQQSELLTAHAFIKLVSSQETQSRHSKEHKELGDSV